MAEFSITRDPKTGRITRKTGVAPGAGRPRNEEVERVRSALFAVLDDETLAAWTLAMRKRLAKGQISASILMLDRLLGKPAVLASIDVDPQLERFMIAWSKLSQPDRDEGEETAGPE